MLAINNAGGMEASGSVSVPAMVKGGDVLGHGGGALGVGAATTGAEGWNGLDDL